MTVDLSSSVSFLPSRRDVLPGGTAKLIDTSGLAPTSRSWNLGGGQTSTGATPTGTYPGPGPYDVSLTVNNASGSGTQTRTGLIRVSTPASSPSMTPPGPWGGGLARELTHLIEGAGASTLLAAIYAEPNTAPMFRIEEPFWPHGSGILSNERMADPAAAASYAAALVDAFFAGAWWPLGKKKRFALMWTGFDDGRGDARAVYHPLDQVVVGSTSPSVLPAEGFGMIKAWMDRFKPLFAAALIARSLPVWEWEFGDSEAMRQQDGNGLFEEGQGTLLAAGVAGADGPYLIGAATLNQWLAAHHTDLAGVVIPDDFTWHVTGPWGSGANAATWPTVDRWFCLLRQGEQNLHANAIIPSTRAIAGSIRAFGEWNSYVSSKLYPVCVSPGKGSPGIGYLSFNNPAVAPGSASIIPTYMHNPSPAGEHTDPNYGCTLADWVAFFAARGVSITGTTGSLQQLVNTMRRSIPFTLGQCSGNGPAILSFNFATLGYRYDAGTSEQNVKPHMGTLGAGIAEAANAGDCEAVWHFPDSSQSEFFLDTAKGAEYRAAHLDLIQQVNSRLQASAAPAMSVHVSVSIGIGSAASLGL